jgi:large subunit ribosomal protein L23
VKEPYQIVNTLIVTEKGTFLKESGNQYVFRVSPDANKIEIRRAVEELFEVHVTKVNTMNRIGKRKRERRWTFGRTSRWKKAVVTLRDGDTIEIA